MSESRLIVVALGGNALSPPSGDPSYAVEREIIQHTALELQTLTAAGHRLLIVHGNGPQVGRLMRDDARGENLDIYVAQTQGELGYLLAQSLLKAGVPNCVGIITRTVVSPRDPGLANPTKAVGPVLTTPPEGPNRQVDSGWRLLVGSPRPTRIPELPAIADLLDSHHVIAGGGGGVPVSADGDAIQGVVDKDWVAALLAIELAADELVFVTDVAGVYESFGTPSQRLLETLDLNAADTLAGKGSFGIGSMGPKVESAVAFTRSSGNVSRITALGTIAGAIQGASGTRITP